MYTEIATNLYVTTTAEVSQPVSMEGANAVLFDFTVYNITGASPNLEVSLWGSNDLQNWFAIEELVSAQGIKVDATTEGHFQNNATSGTEVLAKDVATAYVRLKYDMTSGTAATICAGIQTFRA